ncbi:thioredoxin fold domain-containing protein [Duganella vulcania]|uniref:Thioredoxin fold domain-containing protein n=1 Tax=Duganella vulcania TaxID=2692166 RepID=A0A845GEI7_9BURK|nr:thioredoxin fold domain-containing protein [Duganella vulcania]MYM92714.1 thioredoxin fold domain-containing protein [Duganella vulcania]
MFIVSRGSAIAFVLALLACTSSFGAPAGASSPIPVAPVAVGVDSGAVAKSGRVGNVDGEDSKIIDEVKRRLRKIDGMKRIPGTGMALVEAGDMAVLVSDNGRFVVGKFHMVDLWNSKVITKVADLDGVEKVDLKKINTAPEDLGAFTYGTGPEEVVMFVDPTCARCHNLMSQIPALSTQYTFKIVLLPVLGGSSGELSKKLLCATDKQLAIRALIQNDVEVRLHSTNCDTAPLAKALMISRLIGVEGVPYTLTPKHNVLRGEVKDLAAALKDN